MKHLLCILVSLITMSCDTNTSTISPNRVKSGIELIVLGTTQDAGSPQVGCKKSCCNSLSLEEQARRKVSSLGIIDYDNHEAYIIDASPDFVAQHDALLKLDPQIKKLSGIFLTHAHIGHYTGLMHLGREAMGATRTPVYAMPRMLDFLTNNGPWSQLVSLQNIELRGIQADTSIRLSANLSITPFFVPHRDEYTETVGFKISGPNHNTIFIPDIDKWEKWDQDITQLVQSVDMAFLDATFYDGNELPNRDMAEVPHPFVVESMKLFEPLPNNAKANIHFIHLNHTNPLLDQTSEEYQIVKDKGFNIAEYMENFQL